MESTNMTRQHRYIAEVHYDVGADGVIQLLTVSIHINTDFFRDELVEIPELDDDGANESAKALHVHHFIHNHPNAIFDIDIDMYLKNKSVDIQIGDVFDTTVSMRYWYTILQGIIGKKNMPTYSNTFFKFSLQDASSVTYDKFGRVHTVKVPTLQTVLKRTTENHPIVFGLFHPQPKQIHRSLTRSLGRAVVKRGMERVSRDTLQRNPRGAILNSDMIRKIGEFTAGSHRMTRRSRRRPEVGLSKTGRLVE
jgi:hypothetical protein